MKSITVVLDGRGEDSASCCYCVDDRHRQIIHEEGNDKALQCVSQASIVHIEVCLSISEIERPTIISEDPVVQN